MALYYTVNIRGTILNVPFAIPFHVRLVSGFTGGDEAMIAKSIAEGLRSQWIDDCQLYLSNAMQVTKFAVQGYDSETGFYELPAAILGLSSGDDMPSFIAFGFRQFRTNVLFRASKHAVPGVLEANNAEGSFTDFGVVTAVALGAIAAYFGAQREIVDDAEVSGIIQPVLLRTQNTVTDPVTGTKTTTFFTPHQISDVGGYSFYGLTSQVSRKRILSAG